MHQIISNLEEPFWNPENDNLENNNSATYESNRSKTREPMNWYWFSKPQPFMHVQFNMK